jgi:hypothetical protein
MRLKHNKKRNTAFLYESLVRELTKSILKQDKNRKNKVVEILKQYFSGNSSLKRELDLYKSLYNTSGVDRKIAEKIVVETKIAHRELNKRKIFEDQTSLIKNMNIAFTPKVFNTFVPNFRNIATIYSLFNADVPANERVLLEEKVLDAMSGSVMTEQEMKPVDNIVYSTFVSKFNQEYSGKLLDEQKELLTRYITSFSDNGLEIKVFLNEEIGRLREKMGQLSSTATVSSDEDLSKNSKDICALLEQYSDQKITVEIVETVLKTQQLIHEIEKMDNDND